MQNRYIDAKTFDEFKCNQDRLIEILNHNMTCLTEINRKTAMSNIKLSKDVEWLKKISAWQLGVISALTIGLIVKMCLG
jgi:hypothetical protein